MEPPFWRASALPAAHLEPRVASFQEVCRHRRELCRPELGPPQPLLTGPCRDDFTRRADAGGSGSSRARWMRAARAVQRSKKSGPEARAQVRKTWPLRSLKRLWRALAQTALPAVVRPRRARSRCDSPRSPSAQSGATVYGVRAVALAPNSRVNFLLKFSCCATGQGGRKRVRRCARTPHARPRASAAAQPTPRPEPPRVSRPPPAPRPRFALPAPPMPTLRRPAHAQHAARTARALL